MTFNHNLLLKEETESEEKQQFNLLMLHLFVYLPFFFLQNIFFYVYWALIVILLRAHNIRFLWKSSFLVFFFFSIENCVNLGCFFFRFSVFLLTHEVLKRTE